MTFPLTHTVIGFGPSAADSNARTGTALPINLFHWECRPFQPCRLTQSRRTALDHRPRAQTNCRLLAAADPASRATVTAPLLLSP
jgi:hypothetical protein